MTTKEQLKKKLIQIDENQIKINEMKKLIKQLIKKGNEIEKQEKNNDILDIEKKLEMA